MARKYSKGSCSLFGHSMDSVDKRESEKIEGLNSSHCTGCLVKVIEFKKIYMVLAMLGQDQCLNSRSGTHRLNKELGRHRGREGRRSVCCVMQIVGVLAMCCRIVLPILA